MTIYWPSLILRCLRTRPFASLIGFLRRSLWLYQSKLTKSLWNLFFFSLAILLQIFHFLRIILFLWVTKQNLRHLGVKKWTDDFSHLSVQLQHVLCRAQRSAPQATAWLNLTAFEFAAPVTLSPVCPLRATQTPAALLQPSCFQGSFIPPATPPLSRFLFVDL